MDYIRAKVGVFIGLIGRIRRIGRWVDKKLVSLQILLTLTLFVKSGKLVQIKPNILRSGNWGRKGLTG